MNRSRVVFFAKSWSCFPEVQVVGEAGDGKEALQKIAKLRPDLVFLDLQMPVMGGFEVVRNLNRPRICRSS